MGLWGVLSPIWQLSAGAAYLGTSYSERTDDETKAHGGTVWPEISEEKLGLFSKCHPDVLPGRVAFVRMGADRTGSGFSCLGRTGRADCAG